MTYHQDVTTGSSIGLEQLVGSVDRFLATYWNRVPHLYRGDPKEKFSDLLSVQEIDTLLADQNLREPYLRVIRGGRPLDENRFMRTHLVRDTSLRGVADVEKIAREFVAGATLVFDSIDHYHQPLKRLCDRLSDELAAPAEAVAFVAPRQVPGLTVHYENTEVFVLQLHGIKHWRVFEQRRPLPRTGKVLRLEDLGDPILSVELREGDCLYVPWGSPHFAVSGDTASVHVSIQLRPPTWGDILFDLLDQATNTQDHEAVPLFPVKDLKKLAADAARRRGGLQDRIVKMDLESFLSARSDQRTVRTPARAGFLQQLARIPCLDASSEIARNEAVSCSLSAGEDGSARLRVGSQTFQYPAKASATLQLLVETSGGRVADFSAELGTSAAIKLIGHLVDIGVLAIR